MPRATIFNAARATSEFLYDTDRPELQTAGPSALVLTATITTGRFEGETATIEWIGRFDVANETGAITEWRESVDGRRHFVLELDATIDLDNLDALDALFAGGLEYRGNRFRNVLEGDFGSDRIFGSGGNDRVEGLAGDDLLSGGRGEDRLLGGEGSDTLRGGRDRDLLAGNGGADMFRFRSAAEAGRGTQRDQIADFVSGSDRIDLASIDANSESGGDQAFAFIGGAAFSGTAGELHFSGRDLRGDADGDAKADFGIQFLEPTALTAGDILL